MSEQTIYKIETSSKTEFLYAIHGLDFLLVLWDIDNELRSRIKWGQDSEEVKKGYEDARDLIRETMHSRDLSLDMLE